MTKRPIFSSLPNDFSLPGIPDYRRRQVLEWLVNRRVESFTQMTNLPQTLREELDANWAIASSSVAHTFTDPDGTQKLLVRLMDGKSIETVLMRQQGRRTICLSSQVGCGMGCVFCASGLGGVERNLEPHEMIEQLWHVSRLLPLEERLTHLVAMGMGEPLANLEALLRALEFATGPSPEGLGMSARHVTISTVGLIPKIHRIAEQGRPYHLAVSLHAPNQALRERIVPTAKGIRLEDLITAADAYRAKTRRQVTFEYVLLAGVNDSLECARELTNLLAGRDAFINLIPYNPVAGLGFETPPWQRSLAFARTLREAGFVVRLRKRQGAGINAACGQLRRERDLVVGIAASRTDE